jgi:ABC-type Na+ efflux pump permease subunit
LNSGRIMALARKDWKKMIMDPAVLFMIILFPLVLTIAFGASFGAVGGTQSSTYTIGIVDQGNNTASNQFVQALSGSNLLKLKYFVDNHSAQSALSQGKVQGVLVLPASFQWSIESFRTNPNNPSMWTNATIQLFLDRASLLSSQLSQL